MINYQLPITNYQLRLNLAGDRKPFVGLARFTKRPGVLLLLLFLLPLHSRAHAPSDTFLSFQFTPTNVIGRWEIMARDLQHALGVDQLNSGAVNTNALRLREEALALDTVSGLNLKLDGHSIPIRITDEQRLTRRDGDSLVMIFQSDNWLQRPAQFELNAHILFALDPQIRCILRVEYWGKPQQTILSAARPSFKLDLTMSSSRGAQLLAFIREGIWHIWTGYDHILFLISLLLPAVLIGRKSSTVSRSSQSSGAASNRSSVLLLPQGEGRGEGEERVQTTSWVELTSGSSQAALKPVIINILKIVTAFTVAHSITLALAALHVVELPTRWVESAIAASVIVAASNNIWPVVGKGTWMVAFGFGLIHGFGFANVLNDAGLSKGALTMALIGFNVGVEIGQLAIVVVVVPLAYRFRHTAAYRKIILHGGSIAVIVIAGIWLAERVFDFKFLPF